MATLTPNTIAWLADRGAVKAVRIVGSDEGRVLIEDADGVGGRVARQRLLWVGIGEAADTDALVGWTSRVSADAGAIDIPGCWARLRDGAALDPAPLSAVADALWAGATGTRVDALGVAIFGSGPYFKLRAGDVHPATPRALEEALADREAQARRERAGRIGKAALSAQLEGGDPIAAGLRAGAADADEVTTVTVAQLAALTDLAVFGREAEQASAGKALLRGLDVARTDDPGADACDALVRLGEFERDENLFVRRAGIQTRFSDDVLEAAQAASARPARGSRRRADLTGLLTVAIDDPGTTEVDDAFAFDGDRLVVMIADAAGFVAPGSALFDVAEERVSTLYLPRGKVPMLPPAIGQRAASLLPGEVRPCLAFSFELGSDGQPVAFHVEEATCRVDLHLTYAQADAVLAGEDAEVGADTARIVGRMAEAMRRHADGRLARGALKLQRKDVLVDFPVAGEVRVRAVPADGPGRELIGELMVAVGAATGLHCSDQAIPCIYRTQPAPTGGPSWGSGRIDDVASQIAVLRNLQPSALAVRPGLHSTLGLQAYTQVTSPLRRLGDLVMHEQLKSSLKAGGPRYSAGDLSAMLPTLQQRSTALRRIEGATREYWSLRFLEQEAARGEHGRLWDAVALRPIGRRWKVELSAIGLQAEVRPPNRLQPGCPVKVRVRSVDPRRRRLKLEMAQDD